MPNYGLMGNIAGGIKEGLITYQTLKGMQNDQKQHDENLRMESAAKGLIQTKNPLTGETEYTRDPQFMKDEIALYQAKNPYAANPGAKANQERLGKEAADYDAQGGDASVDTNLGLLQKAKSKLEEPGEISGGISGMMPDRVQDYTNPDFATVRDMVRSGVAGSVKQLFPGSVSDYESKSTFERAINPRLSDTENARRLQAEIDRLQNMKSNKKASFGRFSGGKKGLVAPPQDERITVTDKDGNEFSLPRSQQKDAEAKGYKVKP